MKSLYRILEGVFDQNLDNTSQKLQRLLVIGWLFSHSEEFNGPWKTSYDAFMINKIENDEILTLSEKDLNDISERVEHVYNIIQRQKFIRVELKSNKSNGLAKWLHMRKGEKIPDYIKIGRGFQTRYPF